MRSTTIILSCLLVMVSACAQKAPSHQQWDKLLKQHVNTQGLVDYKGFKKDQDELKIYLKTLSDNAPQDNWNENDKKAFWINAYNANTVSLILQHYPVKSIKDIGAKNSTPWDIQFITIGGKKYNLNNIEHDILRKKFDDARIHFALVCAAMSCPKLQREAYTGDKLNAQLDAAGKDFLNDQSKNKVGVNKADLSNYFSWYKEDFIKKGSLADFINKYSQTKMNDKTKINTIEYNWSLNEQ